MMMGEMFSGVAMGFMGMMSLMGSFFTMLLGPLFGAMSQMFGMMTLQ